MSEIVQRALTANAELAAARIEIARARARLRQAGLRPNPNLDFEQITGRLTGSVGERQTSVGLSVPVEIAGKRARRIDLARAELEVAEAEVADRERRLASEVRAAYAEVLAAARELEVMRGLATLDVATLRVVEARVEEGDAAPLELNLLRVEVDRWRARRALIAGRWEAALLRLKQLAAIPSAETLRLREELTTSLPVSAASLEAATEIALRTRPDLRLAQLLEEAAQAGYRLVRAQAAPQVTAFTRYTDSRSTFDRTPVGVLRDRDQVLSFGVTITLPIFNRNQGAQAEAQLAITQAQRRREFVAATIRAEVATAYRRYEAAQTTLQTYEQSVIARAAQNVSTIRAAYEVGAFRVTELLAEQRRLLELQRELTEVLVERYRALSDLQAALGVTNQQ